MQKLKRQLDGWGAFDLIKEKERERDKIKRY